MSQRLSIGDFHAGLYCGSRIGAVRRWYGFYGLFRRIENGFSLGPILFWKESTGERQNVMRGSQL